MAKPGQLVISQNTMDRIMGSFDTESLGEFALKGLQQKLPVYAVRPTPEAPEPRKITSSDTYHAVVPR